ncbi:MAG: pyridoxal phosphate-dependent aminotransferase [Candidatus Eisenbacteria bacterium]
MASLPLGPFDDLDRVLPPELRDIVGRTTPIPTIAQRAEKIRREDSRMVRADIGQVSGIRPDVEILYGPPVGLDALRDALAELYRRSFQLERFDLPEITGKNVAVTTGAAEALTVLFRCFGETKNVGLPRGYWENYLNSVSLARGQAIVVDYFDAHGNLALDALDRQIQESDLALLVVNFPCNPTGAVLLPEEAAGLAEVARRRDVVLVSDEVYARLRFDDEPPISMLPYAPERTAVIGSASKEYLLPGARVGYVISARERLTDDVLRKVVRANTACPNVPGQQRVLGLVSADLEDLRAGRAAGFLGHVRDELRSRKESLVTVLRRHGFPIAGRAGHDPMGTIFLMAGLPEWWSGSDVEFVEEAIVRHCVSVIPGSAFGLEGTVRFSFGGLGREAIEQLDRNFADWRATV